MAQTDGQPVIDTSLIRVRSLRVSYGADQILRGVNLDVQRGEFVSIVGKSGVGKSTLLYAMARFIPSDGDLRTPQHFGIVFQNYAVYPFLTVAGNIGLGLVGFAASDRSRIVDEYLELIGLAAHADKYPAQLSGGQNQRVALARALAARPYPGGPAPEVIYCDEPFGALDIFTRERMQSWLLDLWEKQKTTIVFVTHSIEEATFLSNRVVVMGNGVLLDEFAVSIGRPRYAEIKFSHEFIDLKRQILESMESAVTEKGESK